LRVNGLAPFLASTLPLWVYLPSDVLQVPALEVLVKNQPLTKQINYSVQKESISIDSFA
jgi:hypothetical protein